MSTPTTSTPSPTPASRLRTGAGTFLANNGALVGLVALCLALFIATPNFLTGPNLLNIGIQASTIAVLAFGMTFVIVAGGIDLSVGSVAALSAMASAWVYSAAGLPGGLSLLAGLATGAALGAISGIAIAFGRLPSFIATLAMLSVARGLTLVLSDGRPIATSPAVSFLGGTLFGIPVPILVLAVAGLVAAFILNRTVVGRSMYAVGGNAEAARLSGIPVKRVLVTVFALAGVYAALAGMLLAGRLNSAQPQAAAGYELDAIAAVVIGGASLAGGVGRVSGTLVGALILAVIRNGLNLLNVSSFWQQVVIGLVIAVAVGIDVLRRKNTRH
ncbi:ABC transporter permease [Isoptericola halotolerans]|uniref:Ribose transport system permease protein n=1 Tax=Isoptericola halotolerans TaxID=300560 RepID=A0ABX2A0R8_9MICO|nr:ABC transporter permease [Isoptericola halotolerans]NOV95480.1 ribose transport system permease protein [Isoptericola halotolerans]